MLVVAACKVACAEPALSPRGCVDVQSGSHAEQAQRGKATVDVIRRHAQSATRAPQLPPGVVVSTKGYQGHFVPTSIYGVADSQTESEQTGVDLASELLEVCK